VHICRLKKKPNSYAGKHGVTIGGGGGSGEKRATQRKTKEFVASTERAKERWGGKAVGSTFLGDGEKRER